MQNTSASYGIAKMTMNHGWLVHKSLNLSTFLTSIWTYLIAFPAFNRNAQFDCIHVVTICCCCCCSQQNKKLLFASSRLIVSCQSLIALFFLCVRVCVSIRCVVDRLVFCVRIRTCFLHQFPAPNVYFCFFFLVHAEWKSHKSIYARSVYRSQGVEHDRISLAKIQMLAEKSEAELNLINL